MARNVMEQLNKNAQKAAVGDETPKARFRTKDISIKSYTATTRTFIQSQTLNRLHRRYCLSG